PSIRFLNSSDLARSPASSSGTSDDSSALIASTIGIIRLTSRSCLVPKIFFSRTSIMTRSLYRARSWGRPSQELAGVAARSVRDPVAGQHARDLLHAGIRGQRLRGDARPPATDAFRQPDVLRRAGRDRGQMRDAEDL